MLRLQLLSSHQEYFACTCHLSIYFFYFIILFYFFNFFFLNQKFRKQIWPSLSFRIDHYQAIKFCFLKKLRLNFLFNISKFTNFIPTYDARHMMHRVLCDHRATISIVDMIYKSLYNV